MPSLTTSLSSFNHYPIQTCILARPERQHELLNISQTVIARGQACSYGDAPLNENGNIILTERLNRFLAFDREDGILTVEAGVTLKEILTVITPHNWFLPVTPGTQYASLGGCIASDVHGKNHHSAGSLGQYIIELELILAHGKIMHCSPQQNAEVFWATVGGMGLTGIINTVVLQLMSIPSAYMQVTQQNTQNLEQTFDYLNNSTEPYSIAWLDGLAAGKNLGGGVIMTARHTNQIPLVKNQAQGGFSIPTYCPNWLLNKTNIKYFNKFYAWQQNKKTDPYITHYQNYFYPLDHIKYWNRLYGKRGFIQYQCVIPNLTAEKTIRQLLEYIQTTAYPIFLASLKQLGQQGSGMLSFPLPGFTLAIDLPLLDSGLFTVLDKLDEMVVAKNGRVYLAKDARLKPDMFRVMYPRHQEWLAIKNKIDPENVFCSSLSKRLEIT